MNLILFSFIFILFTLPAPLALGETTQLFDVLPDFIGYLILWLSLEKRKINRAMRGVYSAVSVMTLISFAFFAGQFSFLFPDFIQGNGKILGWLFAGLTYVYTQFNDLVLLAAVLVIGWMLFSLLEYWEQTDRHKIQCLACKGGLILCGITALCHIGATAIILPFSWHWISYPLSLLIILDAWFVMKESQEMLTGVRDTQNSVPKFLSKNK